MQDRIESLRQEPLAAGGCEPHSDGDRQASCGWQDLPESSTVQASQDGRSCSVCWPRRSSESDAGTCTAGTPPIVEAIGLAAAIDYVQAIGHEAIAAHEAGLLAYATERL